VQNIVNNSAKLLFQISS